MSRLESQAKGGFYPVPPEVVAYLCENYLNRTEDSTRDEIRILDPCAGRGAALHNLSGHLGIPRQNVYAIELEDGRSQEIHETLSGSHVLAPCSAFGARVSRNSFSMIWLNPPFENEIGGGGRVEETFLSDYTHKLRSDGIMAFVCPETVAARWTVKDHFISWFRNVQCVKFPEDYREFGEVCIFGQKRASNVNPDKWQWHQVIVTDHRYTLPPCPLEPDFQKVNFTDSELVEALKASPLRSVLAPPPEPPVPSPPMALQAGHLALMLGAGHLNGVVYAPGEPPHVVRGTERKRQFLKSSDPSGTEDNPTITDVYSERIELVVRTVDVTGHITTLQSQEELENAESEGVQGDPEVGAAGGEVD